MEKAKWLLQFPWVRITLANLWNGMEQIYFLCYHGLQGLGKVSGEVAINCSVTNWNQSRGTAVGFALPVLDWWLHWTNWDGCVISLVFGEAMEWTLRPEGHFCTPTSLFTLVLTVNWSVQSGFACCSLCFGSKDWNLCFIWQLAPALVPLARWLPCVSQLGILSPQVWKARLWTKGERDLLFKGARALWNLVVLCGSFGI